MDKITLTKNEYRRQRWTELIEERNESGLTVQKFCEAKEVNVKTYYYWLRKLRTELYEQSIVPIETMGTATAASGTSRNPSIVMQYGAVKLEIQNGTSSETISAVIEALGRIC